RLATEARARRGRWAVLSVAARSLVDVLASAPRRHRVASRAEERGRGSVWAGTWNDVRQAARRLRRRPSFTFTTVLTLGLGIAATTSVFSLVYGVVLNPLPYPDAARIVEVDHAGPGVGADRGLGITFGFYREYAARARFAEAMAMYSYLEETLTGRGDPVRLRGVAATPSLEAVLGVRPMLGRWFTPEEAEPGAAAAVVLSHRLWRERFGGDVSVVGTSIELGGLRREVVGVMPATFTFPSADRLFWIPNHVPATNVGGWSERAVARLPPGVDAETLRRELVSLLPVLRETTDDPRTMATFLDDARVTPLTVPLKESMVGDVQRTLWILFGTVGLVLLIALANVANLFLVRAEEAQRETAVRRALGAGRGRIVRDFMIETLLVSLAAGVVGVLAAASAIRVLRLRAPVNVPRLDEVGLHPAVLLVALFTVFAAGALLGFLPALRRQAGPAAALADGGRRSTAGRTRRRGREVLMATQVALALVLLIGSGLLFRTFHQLRAVDVGFTERDALTFELGLPSARYETRAEAQAFHLRALERLRGLPGVRSVGAVGRCLPLVGYMCFGETLEVEGHPVVQGQVPPVTGTRIASEDYFRSIGIRVRGRSFTAADAVGAASVAVLSRATAEAYFPGEDALGKRVRFGDGPWHTVVGIADDVRGKVETKDPDELRRVIYLPVLPEGVDGPRTQQLAYVVSTAVPPLSVVPAVRAALAELDPGLPLANVRTLRQIIDAATTPTAFALTLVGLAAAIALLLGTVGVYAVIAYTVSCRTAEIGVRMALGARARDVRAMVLRQGAAVVAVGVGIGLVAAFGLTRLMAGMLYGISPTDPLSYAVLTIFMAAIATLALWLPARRASRIDPMEALRLE
ncbi:MAG: ABC transporter permease, partial [Longimicrobiales bacterium]